MAKMDFSVINDTTTKSFNEQKNLIKRVFKGNTVLCPVCKQALEMKLPTKDQQETISGIRCKKGCTDIELDMELVL
ncbi:Conserved hypothetical protein [Shewanella piezotolerans WP3]|uniref:Uncharacterized protein n=1 Tax=Shewanella piezotolerans (strain WP3 / JCM 13877) TaxID=225849 RepID=B8CQE5_SHEPW|nr:hypothetical protein [Shewanella piezotolerans]ACJ30275.1 Conserved hypothetical protein [Shewanella piezotolerans WP3]